MVRDPNSALRWSAESTDLEVTFWGGNTLSACTMRSAYTRNKLRSRLFFFFLVFYQIREQVFFQTTVKTFFDLNGFEKILQKKSRGTKTLYKILRDASSNG